MSGTDRDRANELCSRPTVPCSFRKECEAVSRCKFVREDLTAPLEARIAELEGAFTPCFEELRTVCDNCIDTDYLDDGPYAFDYMCNRKGEKDECSVGNCPVWKRWHGSDTDCDSCPKREHLERVKKATERRIEAHRKALAGGAGE